MFPYTAVPSPTQPNCLPWSSNDLTISTCYCIGGSITEGMNDLRVNGILRSTRGLGNHGDPPLKKCVISEPYITAVPIDQYAQFVIIASNGLWEVFSENEAVSLLTQVCDIVSRNSVSLSLNEYNL